MNSDNNINILEYCSILILLEVVSFFGISIYTCINYSGVDAWVSIIIGAVIGLFFIFIFNYINSFEADKPLNKKIILLYGKKIGFVINLIILLSFFSILLSSMSNVLIYIVSQFLTQTPLIFIGLLFALMAIYINTKGIEVISRVSNIFLFINIILFLISVLGLLGKVDYSNLLPFLADGFKPVFKSVFYIIMDNIIPIFILLSIPKNKVCKNEKLNKSIYLSYLFSFLVVLIILIVTIGTLGINLSRLYKYPEYIVLKNISLFGFLNNMENILNIQWILGLFIMISISLFSIQSNFDNKKLKNIVNFIACSISLVIIKKVFINDSIFESYLHNVTPYIKITLLGIMLLTSFLIFMKKRSTKIIKK